MKPEKGEGVMDKEIISDVKKKLLDINKTISSLDPAIRTAAFDILAPYYFEDYEPPAAEGDVGKGKVKQAKVLSTGSIEKFFARHEHSKPTDNVFLIAAWIYSLHGSVPVTAKMCQDISGQTGITIPSRPDNTMRQAKRKGKSLFRQQGKGWAPTTHGELFLKETYNVPKGNRPLEESTDA